MTPRQKALLRSSWARIREEPDAATDLFYERLFTISPNSRRLFRNKDMRVQGAAFVQMVGLFMRSLDDKDPGLAEVIEASGRRHVGYGVMYSDYDAAGQALLWAVEQRLGPAFTADIRDAWAEAYRMLAAKMRLASSSVL